MAAVSDNPGTAAGASTEGVEYTDRLRRVGGAGWKRALNVQAPYRWNVRRLRLGRTLDVGCGLGRNLEHLDGSGVGVDHNATSVEVARGKGLTALTVEEFFASPYATPESFDSMLAAHLVEHLTGEQSREILASYLPYVRPGGLVVFITPQERGYASDATHVKFMDFAEVGRLAADLGLTVERGYSFPFPRLFGRLFTYNEFVVVARKP
ncbi:MAG: methyltransferase type 11 [Actinobacteria bacterium 13_1_20CM_3_71_11]|nr:MAG: methyltransferase type 11 [Actinobacteria bacterium 13_1_20CM_3_71_11]